MLSTRLLSAAASVTQLYVSDAPSLLSRVEARWASLPPRGRQHIKHEDPNNEQKTIDMTQFPAKMIRNISIIAHIDHGKSTLASSLLEITGVLSKTSKNYSGQYLDKLKVEKERGITVKAQSASMLFTYARGTRAVVDTPDQAPLEDGTYLINLVDTPGHVDFSYEVSRSLRACQGAVLVVDASQGVQAQTLANFYQAFDAGLEILPVVNKIDLSTADVSRTVAELKDSFEMEPDKIVPISAKTQLNIAEHLLPAIIERIPPPSGDERGAMRAFLFDHWYDSYQGVVCLVNVLDGSIRPGSKFSTGHLGHEYTVIEVGIMHPEPTRTASLECGQVGYLVSTMRNIGEAHIGDTLFDTATPVADRRLVPGFQEPSPKVFAGLYPSDPSELHTLVEAIAKLCLTDASVHVERENSAALGGGLRCGFLGLLHMDVFMQRLRDEHAVEVIATAPTVQYRVRTAAEPDVWKIISNPEDFPTGAQDVLEAQEPWVKATIISPSEYVGPLSQFCFERRGDRVDTVQLDSQRTMLIFRFPLSEIIVDFFDKVKQSTSGFATFEYVPAGYEDADVVKVSIMLNGDPVEPLSMLCVKQLAESRGRYLVEKLKETLPQQQFTLAIQASVGTKVLARATLKQFRKDVTAHLYGGDYTRRMKLLENQKAGKKMMRQYGKVHISPDVFYKVLQR